MFHKNLALLFLITALVLTFISFLEDLRSVSIVRTVFAANNAEEVETFIILRNATYGDVVNDLHEKDFIRRKSSFKRTFTKQDFNKVTPGLFELSKDMSYREIEKALKEGPRKKWVTIPEGLRKEEIAERLTEELEWSSEEVQRWLGMYSNVSGYIEGVYFPDTYLVSKDESPEEIMQLFIGNFNKRFAPYLTEFSKQNIKWTTGLTLASLIQREAAGKEDMSLIAGILWNRLLSGMKLDIDATLQYARGNTGQGWWASVRASDKALESPYNTYKYKGVPPTPIANPGIAAIEAVLFPKETDCFYYLHDKKGKIHCAVTYEEHKENIEKYLR